MAAASPWPLIHAEREALAQDLSSLDEAAWQTPSQVSGPAISLLLAMTGRPAGLSDLSGDGRETLRSRF